MLKRLNKTIVFYCLENRGLVAKILGPSFASILEKKGQSDAQSLAGEDLEVELFLLLQNMDKHLLNKCLKEIPEYVFFPVPIHPSSTAVLFHSYPASFAAIRWLFQIGTGSRFR